MNITYAFTIDSAKDGSFCTAITEDVLLAKWRLGLRHPYETMAAPTAARITVRNVSGRYSPGSEHAIVEIGQVLQISAAFLGTDYVLFTGQIVRIMPQPGDLGSRTAVLHVEGIERALRHTVIRLPPQTMVRPDAVIAAVLERAGAPPALLEAGRTTFTYVGDRWADGISAWDAIAQVSGAERGRFFINRAGHSRFYNRHHMLLHTTPQAVIDNNMEGAELIYGADRVSTVRVRLRPRQLIAADTVLWSVPNAQQMPASSRSHTIIARFRDDVGRGAGALLVIPPRPGIDFSANTRRDGTGTDVTALVEVTLQQVDFSAVVLRLRCPLAQTVYLLPGMQLVGTPVYGGDPITLEHTDADAATRYGPAVLSLDLPALDCIEQGDDLARFELGRRRQPQMALRTLSTSTRSHAAEVLARTLFDAISVTDAHTGHTGIYLIVGESHTVDLGGHRHRVTWTLEPVDTRTFWRLGQHHLDQETILAF